MTRSDLAGVDRHKQLVLRGPGYGVSIAKAAGRLQLHSVPIKSVEQQDLAMRMKLGDGLIMQRTCLIN